MIGLDLVWLGKYLADLVSGVVGDRLKPKTSAENARDAALDLYEGLRGLARASDDFIAALQKVSADRSASSSLTATVDPLRKALNAVNDALHRLDPQLSLHAPEIDWQIQGASHSRAVNMDRAEDTIARMVSGGDADIALDDAELADISSSARRTGEEIHAAVETLRQFLATQFTFKESFRGRAD